MPSRIGAAPEIVRTTKLKGVSLALPEDSVSRALIQALPDELPLSAYLDKAEALGTVIFTELRAAEAAKSAIPSYRKVARESIATTEVA
jgi:hypothetical protein